MVEISMGEIKKLYNEVNDFLRKDNRSSYLKITYKKVLFLVVFIEKKKYYDILHISKLNFNNKLFIWEIKTIKRGQFNLFRKIEKRIIKESMKINNIYTLHQIVKDIIKETINDISQKNLNEIIKTAV